MRKINISIVIPIYNVNKYIEKCLLSVVNQSYIGNIECLLINDCTPDDSIDIAKKIINNYKGNIKFRIINHDKNMGLSAARNTGLDNAFGEYIYFLDGDDEITYNCIEDLCKPLEFYKYDFVIGNYCIKGIKSISVPSLQLKTKELSDNKEIISSYEKNLWYMMAWNKLCNISYLRGKKLYFKENLTHEDDLWSFQLACTANKIYIVDKVTYIYKLRENSIITSNKLEHHIKSITMVIKYMIDFIDPIKVNNIAYNIIYNYKLSVLKQAKGNKEIFKSTYIAIRNLKSTDKNCCFNSRKAKIYSFIFNLHYYLPINISCIYVYIYIKLLLSHPLKRMKKIFFV